MRSHSSPRSRIARGLDARSISKPSRAARRTCSCAARRRDMPRNVVAIGKCAGALLDGVAAVHDDRAARSSRSRRAIRCRVRRAEVHVGGHPHMTRGELRRGTRAAASSSTRTTTSSFSSPAAARRASKSRSRRTPRTRSRRRTRGSIASGLTDRARSTRAPQALRDQRRQAARARARPRVTLVYSDVSTGALADVASGSDDHRRERSACSSPTTRRSPHRGANHR